jgi:protein SCO1/2
MELWSVFVIFASFLGIHSSAQQTFDPTSLSITTYRSAKSLLSINLPDGGTIRSFIAGQQTAIPGYWLISGQSVTIGPQEEKSTQLGIDKSKIAHNQPDYEIPPPPTLTGIPARQITVGRETKFLPDLVLLDQDGHSTRFYTDLIKGKSVILSFFYTTCSYMCTRQGKVFSELQTELGDRLGKDIFLISVTMDPETDTPERLRNWGKQYGQRKGWTMVTGGKVEMEKLVGHLTGNPLGRLEMHAPFVYLGNDKKNKWTATFGLAAPKTLLKQIEEM